MAAVDHLTDEVALGEIPSTTFSTTILGAAIRLGGG